MLACAVGLPGSLQGREKQLCGWRIMLCRCLISLPLVSLSHERRVWRRARGMKAKCVLVCMQVQFIRRRVFGSCCALCYKLRVPRAVSLSCALRELWDQRAAHKQRNKVRTICMLCISAVRSWDCARGGLYRQKEFLGSNGGGDYFWGGAVRRNL